MDSRTKTLWRMLRKYKGGIKIPIIQRDYAQGREDQATNRGVFLSKIKSVLDKRAEDPNSETYMLSYVYGYEEKGVKSGLIFCPFDGQQRLTTLWLLHWYLAFMTNRLNENSPNYDNSIRERLIRFSYKTRNSSTHFCEKLCEKMKDPKSLDGKTIKEYIEDQTWFFKVWIQDPTVNGMLRAISGDENDSDSCIEKMFSDKTKFDFYFLQLTKSQSPAIAFPVLFFEDGRIPRDALDDMYIKMNSRGKPLTNFENFKADLIAWFDDSENPEKAEFESNDEESKIEFDGNKLKRSLYYPTMIDVKWIDVFWDHAKDPPPPPKEHIKDEPQQYDDLYFRFINRCVFNRLILNNKDDLALTAIQNASVNPKLSEDPKPVRYSGKGNKESRSATDNSEERSNAYTNYITFFYDYKNYFTLEFLEWLDRLFDTLLSDDAEIKRIVEGSEIWTSLFWDRFSYPNSVQFYSYCLFLADVGKIGDENIESLFDDWKRVVDNIVNNADINSKEVANSAHKAMKELADLCAAKSWRAYEAMAERYNDPNVTLPESSWLTRQIKEEYEKAAAIWEERKAKNGRETEDLIKKAERHAFFDGAIRFLYRDATNSGTPNWGQFKQKAARAMGDPDTNGLFHDKTVNGETIIELLRHYRSFEEIREKFCFTTVGYSSEDKSKVHQWKTEILLSSNEADLLAVHNMLMGNDVVKIDKSYEDLVSCDDLLWYLIKLNNHKTRYARFEDSDTFKELIYPKDSQRKEIRLIVGEERKKKCAALKNRSGIQVDSPLIGGYYIGDYILFTAGGRTYEWRYDGDFTDTVADQKKNKVKKIIAYADTFYENGKRVSKLPDNISDCGSCKTFDDMLDKLLGT